MNEILLMAPSKVLAGLTDCAKQGLARPRKVLAMNEISMLMYRDIVACGAARGGIVRCHGRP